MIFFLFLLFSEMWYGVFLWAGVSSMVFHLPAALLALATLRGHKIARFFPLAIMLMAIIGPLFGGVLTSTYPTIKYQSGLKQVISNLMPSTGFEAKVHISYIQVYTNFN